MTALLSVILGLLVLGVLVFIHELGHFLAAKACGIRVLAFSLGFGKPLITKLMDGTEYRISAIPFGGYVKMAGENPDDERTGASDEFQSKPVWQRMIVAIAGPLFNYVSAFFMLWVLFMTGIERPLYLERPVVGAVTPGSVAQNAGIVAGDSIATINGKSVADWEAVEQAFVLQEPEYTLTVFRNDTSLSINMVMKRAEKDSLFKKDITGGLLPALPAVVAEVLPSSAAEAAGVSKGDNVIEIDGTAIYSWFQLVGMVEKHRGDTPLSFVIRRNEHIDTLSLLPRYDKEEGRSLIGIRVTEGSGRIVRYQPPVALTKAANKTWENTVLIFEILGKLFSRRISTKQISGPLGIIPASGFMALQGLGPILQFMALIGINLAVLNLMPLIITDGGLIFFMIIEVIRRKPLSMKTQLAFNKVAMALFLALFLIISFNDVKRMPQIFKLFGK